jgi:transposase
LEIISRIYRIGHGDNFRRGDPDQPFLLPPDLRDWLPADHFAWFVGDVADQLDLGPFLRAHRADGHGHPAYDPKTLLGVLLYAYAIGVRSSRQIARRCREASPSGCWPATRPPDHMTIARFRVRHQHALAGFLVQSLQLCAEAGLVRLGTVALDGTKVAGNAADKANRCARPPKPTSATTSSTAMPVGTSYPPRSPPRPAGWRGCGRPRRSWELRRPSANAGMSSGSPSWPPQPGQGQATRARREGGAAGALDLWVMSHLSAIPLDAHPTPISLSTGGVAAYPEAAVPPCP